MLEVFLDHEKSVSITVESQKITHINIGKTSVPITATPRDLAQLTKDQRKIFKQYKALITEAPPLLQIQENKVQLIFPKDQGAKPMYDGFTLEIASIDGECIEYQSPLTVYDTRHLYRSESLTQAVRLIRYRHRTAQGAQLSTDLHSHFAAAITAEDLISAPFRLQQSEARSLVLDRSLFESAGMRPDTTSLPAILMPHHEVYYPTQYLIDMGLVSHNTDTLSFDGILDTVSRVGLSDIPSERRAFASKVSKKLPESADRTFIRLSEIPQSIRDKMAQKLSFTTTERTTFDDMERRYNWRATFTKDPRFFKQYLWDIARYYQKHGVEYTSQSFTRISDPEWLRIAEEELPRIESPPPEGTGVKIRFLVGMPRSQAVGVSIRI